MSLLEHAKRLVAQGGKGRNKPRSAHEEAHCIARGKSHKRRELGEKTCLAVTSRSSWIALALRYGNPYDSHRLGDVLTHIAVMTGERSERLRCDLGRSRCAVEPERGSCGGTHSEKCDASDTKVDEASGHGGARDSAGDWSSEIRPLAGTEPLEGGKMRLATKTTSESP